MARKKPTHHKVGKIAAAYRHTHHKPPILGNQRAKKFSPQKRVLRNRKPIGSKLVANKMHVGISHRKPTGINRQFRRTISPGGYLKRTSWSKSKTHHTKLRVRTRRPRTVRVQRWRKRSGRFTPR